MESLTRKVTSVDISGTISVGPRNQTNDSAIGVGKNKKTSLNSNEAWIFGSFLLAGESLHHLFLHVRRYTLLEAVVLQGLAIRCCHDENMEA